MEIKHKKEEKGGEFYVEKESRILAKLTYRTAGADRIIIDHTEVNDELKGLGVGKQLLVKAVEYARDNGIKIQPLCPFAKSLFDKIPEFSDVLF